MSLTADQLFTPAPSGVGTDVGATPPSGSWFATLIANCQITGLPTTSWQPGSPERTILAADALALYQSDVLASLAAQGGFLDFAATGTVVSVDTDGTATTIYVTPDPSDATQNPTGAPGWLDALGQSYFQVPRLQASYATGTIAIANTGITSLSYLSGSYHVANANTGATYKNVNALSVPTGVIGGTGGSIAGVVTGTTTTINTVSAHGLLLGDTVYFLGAQGVTGLNGFFAIVTNAAPTSFTISIATIGTWTAGGNVYKCTTAAMVADLIGPGSNAGAGQVSLTVTQNTGVFVGNLTPWVGANYETNVAYAARLRLSLAALSPNGPGAAYDYFARSAAQIFAAQTPPATLTNGPIVDSVTFTNPQTQVTTCVVASSTPASPVLGNPVTPGCAQLPISVVSTGTPIAVTTSGLHGLSTGNGVVISGVLGNTAANGSFTIVQTSPTSFTLNGTIANGAYLGGGTVEGGDLGLIDALLQSKVVNDGTIAMAASALAFPVAITATVVVPQAYVATYTIAAQVFLNALIASYPIGGIAVPGSGGGTIEISAIEGALSEAGLVAGSSVSYVRQFTNVTINGSPASVPYPSPNHKAYFAVPSIQVVGV